MERPGGSRRQARVLAMQALFQMDVGGQALEAALASVLGPNPEPGVARYVEETVRGVVGQVSVLDSLIEEKSRNWRLERMPRVDRTILRMGAYELLFRPEVPASVAINEAVELAKEFGDQRSAAFVNAILDSLKATGVKPA
jgi:N utilization substance protein B